MADESEVLVGEQIGGRKTWDDWEVVGRKRLEGEDVGMKRLEGGEVVGRKVWEDGDDVGGNM